MSDPTKPIKRQWHMIRGGEALRTLVLNDFATRGQGQEAAEKCLDSIEISGFPCLASVTCGLVAISITEVSQFLGMHPTELLFLQERAAAAPDKEKTDPDMKSLAVRVEEINEKWGANYASLHEAWAVLYEEVMEAFELVRLKTEYRDWQKVRAEFLDIAVVAMRAMKQIRRGEMR